MSVNLKNVFNSQTNGGGWFSSFGWGKNSNRSQSNPLPMSKKRSRSNKKGRSKDDKDQSQILKTDQFRRNKKKKQISAEYDTKMCSLVTGLSVDNLLSKQTEQERNTRKLTLEREKRKQEKLRQLKEEKKTFDIALIVNNNDEYDKILCGPVIFEVFYKYIRFIDCQNYIQNDIKILQKCTKFQEELSIDKISDFFCNLSEDDSQNGVRFNFGECVKVQLFKFNENKQLWIDHKYGQKKLHCDVFIIANNKNVPIYVFLDVDIDLIEEEIRFDTYHEYQRGDIDKMDELGTKLNEFELDSAFSFFKKDRFHLFPHNFNKNIHHSFETAICYNFNCMENKHIFFHQNYDIAVIINDNDEMLYILNEIEYNLLDGTLNYKSKQIYRNGDYQKLTEYGLQIKSIKVNGYYKNNECRCIEWNQCILFSISEIDSWSNYIKSQKNCHYDCGIITDSDNYNSYILNDVMINWIDQYIEFKICDTFKSEHDKIIKHYGEFIISDKIQRFKYAHCSDPNTKMYHQNIISMNENILLYQLKSHSHNTEKRQKRESAVLKSRESSNQTQKRLVNSEQSTNKTNSNLNHNQNITNNLHIIAEDIIDDNIWEIYVSQNGFPPKNPQQLYEFIKYQMKTNEISYINAKEIFENNVSTPHIQTPIIMNRRPRDSVCNINIKINQPKAVFDRQLPPDPPPKSRKHPNVNNAGNNDKGNDGDHLKRVWDAYIELYGFEPANPQQLRVFSKVINGVQCITYKDARQLFNNKVQNE